MSRFSGTPHDAFAAALQRWVDTPKPPPPPGPVPIRWGKHKWLGGGEAIDWDSDEQQLTAWYR